MKFELVAIGEVEPDFLSSRIQAAIHANYSHVGILVDGTDLYHATGKGFHKSLICQELNYQQRHWFFWKKWKKAVIRRRVVIPIENDCCALTWLHARLGLRYSNIQYLGFIFPFLRFLPFVSNGRSEVVCSEVAADFVAENGKLSHIAAMAFESTDFICPRKCMDIAAGIYGESNE